MKIGIFIFRRDLRIIDNTTLILLSEKCDFILPIFILDPYQIILNNNNKYYFSYNTVQFICDSLIDLNNQLIKKKSKLHLFYGNPKKIIKNIIEKLKSKFELIIGFNTDFSLYSIQRDNDINNICLKYNIELINSDKDFTLLPINQLLLNDSAYKQFGPFYKNALKYQINKPVKKKINFIILSTIKEYNINDLINLHNNNPNLKQNGNRKFYIKILNNINIFNNYDDLKNDLTYDTSNLSAGLNLGLISIRETFWKINTILGENHSLTKQLFWRDFYLCAFNYIENAKSFNLLMDSRYDLLNWSMSDIKIKYWNLLLNAKTGFLLIDASIMQMKQTGFLHGRCRMLLGIFWTKYLQINILDPKYGSQVGFSKYLIDAIGPTQNKMNHHWILDFDYAGKKFSKPGIPLSGRPMNIDNNIIKKYDKNCIYIKKWLPHLQNVDNKDIFNWSKDIHLKYNKIHPYPIFDPKEKYNEWLLFCS
jgi:deoxyribodipyrimidine photo-lyase